MSAYYSSQFLNNYLLSTVPSDLTVDDFNAFSDYLLKQVQQKNADYVILDFSSFQYMDRIEFMRLQKLVKLLALLGAETICHGLKPGIVSNLVELISDFDGMIYTPSLETAIDYIEQQDHG